jgi:hypothetical protein
MYKNNSSHSPSLKIVPCGIPTKSATILILDVTGNLTKPDQ